MSAAWPKRIDGTNKTVREMTPNERNGLCLARVVAKAAGA